MEVGRRAAGARRVGIAAVAIACSAACGSADPLSSPEHIAGWANVSSALGVFSLGYDPLAYADGQLTFEDPSCPVTSDDGTTVTITGDDCVASDGTTWLGSATVVRSGSGDRSLTMRSFGKTADPDIFSVVTGSVEVTEQSAERHAFDADVTQHGGLATSILYAGTVEGTYGGPTVWNGSGSVARSGGAIVNGEVDAETVDELRDSSVCTWESLSGRTTLTSEAHTVVITYDGSTDCDDDNSARWSLDGADQGLVAGVVCSVGPAGRGGSRGAHTGMLLSALLLLGAVSWMRGGLRRAR